jgi:sporulation protein YlmC with PRC-barrel domain
MQISHKTLLGLAVETELGQHVGKVHAFTLDIDEHRVRKYEIKVSRLFTPALLPETLLIDPSQVIRITREKMIVQDLATKDLESRAAKTTTPLKDPGVASLSKHSS